MSWKNRASNRSSTRDSAATVAGISDPDYKCGHFFPPALHEVLVMTLLFPVNEARREFTQLSPGRHTSVTIVL